MERVTAKHITQILMQVEGRPEIPGESPLEILRGALEIMRKQGWTRHTYHNAAGYCAVGALRAVSHSMGIVGAVEALEREIADQYGERLPVTWWNDKRARAFPEVEAIFEKAIMRLEEQVEVGR